MKRRIAEWLWRVAVLTALGALVWQLQRLHEDIVTPVDDTSSMTASNDDTQESLDAIRDDISGLERKLDAILVVLARSSSK